MAEIEAKVGDNFKYIYLDTPYKYKNLCKSIRGRRWDKNKKKWKYPRSPAVAAQIYRKFKHKKEGFDYDDDFKELLETAKQVRKAQELKDKPAGELPDIKNSNYPAWEHQKQAYHFAKNLHSCGLFMDMGTGKTKVTIDLINNRGHKKVLVVCPLSVVDVWPQEVRKHSPHNNFRILALNESSVAGKKEKAAQVFEEAQALDKTFIAVINYESVWREPFGKWAKDIDWDLVVADESHRIKSPGAKCSLYMSRLGKSVPYKLALTGTPLANDPLDIYGQYRFLDPGIFGTSFNRFKQRYAVMGGYGGYEIQGYKNETQLNKKIYSIAYKCDSEEVLDLPDTIDMKRYCTLEDKTMEKYTEIENNFYTQIEEQEVTAFNALTKLLRLQQITSGFVGDDEGEINELGTAKPDLLKEVINNIPQEEEIVIFARFRHDLEVIHRVAEEQERRYCELSGKINQLKDFQKGKYNVIGVQIQSGGVGIDLTRSNYVIYYSLGFSLKNFEQSRARIHRPGQNDTVRFIKLIAKNTVDEKVEASLNQKREIVDYILEEIQTEMQEV